MANIITENIECPVLEARRVDTVDDLLHYLKDPLNPTGNMGNAEFISSAVLATAARIRTPVNWHFRMDSATPGPERQEPQLYKSPTLKA